MSRLRVRSLVKQYRGTDAPAVDHVDLEVASGKLVSVLGPSGCGKTTLLRSISGFLTPDSGSVELGDEDITDVPPHRRDVGMVYQNYALWPHMTVDENVSFGLEMRGIGRDERRERVREALGLVDLVEYGDRYPPQLSGGQQQRVGIARALVIRPRLLLFDEPLSSLDAKLRNELRFQIRNLQKRLGVTALFVTHDQEEALAVADSVVLMHAGRIIQAGSGETLYREPASHFAMTFMGEVNEIAGTVKRVDGDELLVDSEIGTVTCARPLDVPLAEGTDVRIGLRPEDVGLSHDEQPDSIAPARVETVTFLGPWTRYKISVEGVTLYVRHVSSHSPFAAGDRTHLNAGPQSWNVVRPDVEGSDQAV